MMEDLVAMKDEWEMWTRAGRLLRDANIDMDDHGLGSAIATAFALWGETLVRLRVGQSNVVQDDAYQQAQAAFNASLKVWTLA